MNGSILIYDKMDENDNGEILNIFTSVDSNFHFFSDLFVLEENDLKKILSKELVESSLIRFKKEESFLTNLIGVKKASKIKKTIFDSLMKSKDNYLSNITRVIFSMHPSKIKKILDSNKELLNKEIVIKEYFELNEYDKIKLFMNELKDYSGNIKILMQGNDEYFTLKDCYDIFQEIIKTGEEIKKINLSPMETIMYTYDMVRNKVYKYEDEDEPSYVSRSINEILHNDKIVCLGFSNLFNSILTYLGIDNDVTTLHAKEKNKSGHARNRIYIKDDKYGIDGIYYFDATFDCKKDENDKSYLNSYRYFARIKNDFINIDQKYQIVENYMEEYSLDIYERIEKSIEKRSFKPNLISTISKMFRICHKEFKIENIVYGIQDDDFLVEIKDVCDKFKKPIPTTVLLRLINNVRIIENEQNPDYYPYSYDVLFNIFRKTFNLEEERKVVRLLNCIFGESNHENIDEDIFKRKLYESGITKKNIDKKQKVMKLKKVL